MQNIGFILIGLGVLTLLARGFIASFIASDIPTVLIRIAVGAISVGILVLIVAILI